MASGERTAKAEPACCASPDADGADEDDEELPGFTFAPPVGVVGFEDVLLLVLLLLLLLVVLVEMVATMACDSTVSVLLAAF